ncbi:hypothetical protein KIL84_009342 [Mauremys mutica]|uniref:Uncharacterized protein n=1 Tax=Mauremys mutica TaxID=74926 RepID=A0A9D3XIR6_9SAUR|nr:hypothetical protein KIL84_009342 [Mauremys mutica]
MGKQKGKLRQTHLSHCSLLLEGAPGQGHSARQIRDQQLLLRLVHWDSLARQQFRALSCSTVAHSLLLRANGCTHLAETPRLGCPLECCRAAFKLYFSSSTNLSLCYPPCPLRLADCPATGCPSAMVTNIPDHTGGAPCMHTMLNQPNQQPLKAHAFQLFTWDWEVFLTSVCETLCMTVNLA